MKAIAPHLLFIHKYIFFCDKEEVLLDEEEGKCFEQFFFAVWKQKLPYTHIAIDKICFNGREISSRRGKNVNAFGYCIRDRNKPVKGNNFSLFADIAGTKAYFTVMKIRSFSFALYRAH